jgi:molecular chaperone GrpE
MPDEQTEIIDEEESEQNQLALLQKLRGKLKACEAERQEYLTGWQRAKADLVNARRDAERERETFARFAAEGLIRELLSVLESFEMAFADKAAWEQAPPEWRKGIEHIHAQLVAVLERAGLTSVNPIGEQFDPSRHESAGEQSVERAEDDHKIVAVVRKGYRLYDKLVQPARVIVGII